MKIVALYSSHMQCGKTSAAVELGLRCGYTRVSFSAPLKKMTMAFLGQFGRWSEQELHDLVYSSRKDEDLGIPWMPEMTSRYIQQTLGTEWGRDMVNKDLWVKMAFEGMKPGGKYVIDDLRFPSEMAAIKSRGGETMRIKRDSVSHKFLTASGHASEGALDGEKFDHVINNDGSEEEFLGLVRLALGYF